MEAIIPALAILGGALAVAVTLPLSDGVRTNLTRAAAAVGWIGVLGGAIGIYTANLAGLGTLVGTAACAGLAVLPMGMRLAAARDVATAVGGVVPLVAGILAIAVGTQIHGTPSGALLLYAGHWGALGAALVSALIAAALSAGDGWSEAPAAQQPVRRTLGLGLGLAIAALCFGAYLIGAMRGGPEGLQWSVPLVSSGGMVTWQIPPSPQLPQGLWLDAVADVSWLAPLLIAAAVVAVATGVATLFDASKRASVAGWLATGVASLAGVAGLLQARGAAKLPDAGVYRDTATSIMSDVQNARALAQQGQFVATDGVHVTLASIAPELGMLVVATLLAALAVVFAYRRAWPGEAQREPGRAIMSLYARDYAYRAVVLGWLSWLLATLIHWNEFGAVGFGSPAEWSAVGALAVMTGVLLAGWSRSRRRVESVGRQLAPGILAAVLVLGIAAAVVFNAPFGLSIAF